MPRSLLKSVMNLVGCGGVKNANNDSNINKDNLRDKDCTKISDETRDIETSFITNPPANKDRTSVSYINVDEVKTEDLHIPEYDRNIHPNDCSQTDTNIDINKIILEIGKQEPKSSCYHNSFKKNFDLSNDESFGSESSRSNVSCVYLSGNTKYHVSCGDIHSHDKYLGSVLTHKSSMPRRLKDKANIDSANISNSNKTISRRYSDSNNTAHSNHNHRRYSLDRREYDCNYTIPRCTTTSKYPCHTNSINHINNNYISYKNKSRRNNFNVINSLNSLSSLTLEPKHQIVETLPSSPSRGAISALYEKYSAPVHQHLRMKHSENNVSMNYIYNLYALKTSYFYA